MMDLSSVIHYLKLGHETKVPVEDKEVCFPIAEAQVRGQIYSAHKIVGAKNILNTSLISLMSLAD